MGTGSIINLLSLGLTYTTPVNVEDYSGCYSMPAKCLDGVRQGSIYQTICDYQPMAQPSLRDSEPPQSTPDSGSREIIWAPPMPPDPPRCGPAIK